MASLFMRAKVADYAMWKPLFDENEPLRREYGTTGHSLHRDADDPNVVYIALRVSDLNRAKEFAASEELRSAMEKAGVQGPPDIWFADDVEEKRY